MSVQLAAATAATVYAGPPAWTFGRVFSEWQAEPVVLAIAILGSAGYLLGLVRLRRFGVAWTFGRTAAFLLGMALWVFTVCSGLGVYEKYLFTDRAVQSVVLLMVVPLLLAMGAPISVLVEAAPERFREGIRALLRGRAAQVLMFPLVSTVVLIVPPWLLYFTPWYRLSLTTDLWNVVFHVAFVLFGLAYFWPRLQIDPVGRHYHPLLGVVITVAEVIFDAALGFILVFGSHMLVPDYWASLHRPWGMSPRTDQSWGGAVLWGLGDIAGVPFLVALIIRVVREDRIETAKVDRRLDEEAVARVAAQSAPAEVGRAKAAAPAAPEEESMRPWWLDDPNLAHRFGTGES
ncbi:cytochrome c oxidase assembly protein [Streptacidiphilus sp. P02-A3a]|uniref:cytochrome c oxidase assembly protein n=1 Tax=Streptacidiphilus sp. P02-A3a TaxID=2704468 RepID=UPI0015FB0919|nr:cytochrome c oxidase assembly protein [Streptacidiphilus sp. P02-A3a]QMU68920.1 cytochrome c oxidase assembly protein [Streptacidiphilus sp. P02-A3a]